MKTLPPNAKLNVPDEQERRQIFYWLQKVTSLTAWRRILMRYQAWAIATENSLRVADETGLANTTSLSHSEYALVLKCLAHCEEGVLRLAQGDKRIFKFDANGEFVMAQRMLSHWTTMIDRIEIGETRVNPNTSLWEPFTEALDTLGRAWGECGPWILERRFIEDPATIFYGEPLTSMWQTMWFPPALEPVPDPAENTFVRTGRPVPCSGIWEPIDANTARPTSMLSMFKRTPEPQAPFQIVGAMSFLHGASNAPPVTVETADDVFDIDTTWRLLWRDDRYKTGLMQMKFWATLGLQQLPLSRQHVSVVAKRRPNKITRCKSNHEFTPPSSMALIRRAGWPSCWNVSRRAPTARLIRCCHSPTLLSAQQAVKVGLLAAYFQ